MRTKWKVKLLNREIAVTRKFTVLLRAVIFQGPLAGETEEAPWGNSFHTVEKNTLGSIQFRCSLLSQSQGGL